MSDLSRTNIPDFYVIVPGTGVNLVGVDSRVLYSENLVVVALVLFISELQKGFICLGLVELDLGA
jgi:hypothetical protein